MNSNIVIIIISVLVVGGVFVVALVFLGIFLNWKNKQKSQMGAKPSISTSQADTPQESSAPKETPPTPKIDQKICASCGHGNPQTHNFCERCGQKV